MARSHPTNRLRRVAATLGIVLAFAACSVNSPKPPRCDGSARLPVNAASATAASALPSRSCSAAA